MCVGGGTCLKQIAKAIYPVMKVSRGSGRFSERILQRAILIFYKDNSLWPRGIVEEMSCIQLWSLKVAKALCRLAASLNFFHVYVCVLPTMHFLLLVASLEVIRFRRLMQLSATAKSPAIAALKDRCSGGVCAAWLRMKLLSMMETYEQL